MSECGYRGCSNEHLTVRNDTRICYDCLDTVTTCAKWQCDNRVRQGHSLCDDHPPLVDHGLTPNTVACPECEHEGAGTIHDDLWYCRADDCGELFDPYHVAGVEKERKW